EYEEYDEDAAYDEEEYEEEESYDEEEAEYEDDDYEDVPARKSSIPVVTPKMSDKKSAAKKAAAKKTAAQKSLTLSDNEVMEWEFPPVSLITDVPPESAQNKMDETALRRNAELLQNVLTDYGVK